MLIWYASKRSWPNIKLSPYCCLPLAIVASCLPKVSLEDWGDLDQDQIYD